MDRKEKKLGQVGEGEDLELFEGIHLAGEEAAQVPSDLLFRVALREELKRLKQQVEEKVDPMGSRPLHLSLNLVDDL